MTGRGLFLPEANDGARTFSSGKNDGARTFSKEKNDRAETFSGKENDGAETFLGPKKNPLPGDVPVNFAWSLRPITSMKFVAKNQVRI